MLEWPPGGARTREAGRPAPPHVRGEAGRRRDDGGRGDDWRTTLPGAERGAAIVLLGLDGLGEQGLACAAADFIELSGGRPLILCGFGALPIACCWQRIAASRCRSLRLASPALLGDSCATSPRSSSRRSESARRQASSAEIALNFVRVSPSARRRHSRTCILTIWRLRASCISPSLYGVMAAMARVEHGGTIG